jgi:hypothetical protein
VQAAPLRARLARRDTGSASTSSASSGTPAARRDAGNVLAAAGASRRPDFVAGGVRRHAHDQHRVVGGIDDRISGMPVSAAHPKLAPRRKVEVRLTAAAHERLRTAAAAHDRTMQAEARWAIREHLERVLRGPQGSR